MTPDELQWCLDELARQGCTHGAGFAHYDPAIGHLSCQAQPTTPGHCCTVIWITPAQIAQFAAQTKAASANAPNAPTPVRHILSQHGGKRIPVVPSHSYVAALSKKQAQAPELRLDYKTHILVGTVASGVGVILLQVWHHLPTQAEIDAVIAHANACGIQSCTSYALVTPTNCW